MKTRALLLALGVVAVAGCGDDDLTEILVVVDSNLRVPAEIDTISVQVDGVTGGPLTSNGMLAAGTGAGSLPRTLALVHGGGSLGPIDVRAQALLGATLVVSRRARVSFVPGQIRVLRLSLDGACRGVSCTGETTCAGGTCRSVDVAETELEPWTGAVTRLDGGVSDACVPSPERCNGVDDDCDGVADDGIDLMTDPANCGRCGMRCVPPPNATSACAAGSCTLDCVAGFANCDGMAANGCENDLTSPTTCGSCTNDCSIPHTTSTCDGTSCTMTGCEVGWDDCDAMASTGCETSLATLTDCGACGTGCDLPGGTETCATGTCAVDTCDVGAGNCDGMASTGCERSLRTLTDCDACDVPCALPGGTETCATGTCAVGTCDMGLGDCDRMAANGCEQTLTTPTHCGMCDNPCAPANATGDCATGACVIGSCDVGFGDCDRMAASGCEVTLATDDLHCGMCGTACSATQTCVAGTCRGDTEVLEVSGGAAHSCARQVAGTVQCWGSNANGQLGNASTTDSTVPVPVSMLTDAVQIAAGGQHTCARRRTGAVVCWGANADGQLGDGSTTRRTAPAAVTGLTDAVWIAAGALHTCAVRATGAVVCWGDNGDQQIGDGAGGARRTAPAVAVGITDAVRVTAGGGHTCALRSSGAVACWGRNASGQLGDGSTTRRGMPVAVGMLADAAEVAAGADHTCAVRATGAVACWGDNAGGQLGVAGGDRNAPVAVAGLTDAAEISAGGLHTCVRHTGGTASCWGRNVEGQIGDGTTTARPMPTAVMGLADAVGLDVGTNHGCAARATGGAVCWGANAGGQLGDTSRTNRSAPVPVNGLP